MEHKNQPVTIEVFEKHTAEDMENFQKLRLQNDTMEQERRKRHEEIMSMLRPVYEAFTFRKELDDKTIKAVVRWSKVLGFIVLVVTILVYIWKTIVFGVTQIPK